MKQQQYDNLKAQNTISLEQAKLLEAQTAKTQADTASTLFTYDMDNQLKETSMDYRRSMLKKLNNEVDSSMYESNLKHQSLNFNYETWDARKNMLFYQSLDAKQKTIFNKMDFDMRKEGIQPNDPMYMRILYRQFGDMGSKIKQLLNTD